MYEQVVGQVKQRILSGDLSPGTPLPSIRQLAAQLVISVMTTKRAYQELEAEGLIVTRPGVGSVVAPLTEEQIQQLRVVDLEQQLLAVVGEARRRGVDDETVIDLLRQVMERQ